MGASTCRLCTPISVTNKLLSHLYILICVIPKLTSFVHSLVLAIRGGAGSTAPPPPIGAGSPTYNPHMISMYCPMANTLNGPGVRSMQKSGCWVMDAG